MKAVVDVDETILRKAERQAREQGRTLAALVEEGLRTVIHAPPTPPAVQEPIADALDANDPFFSALDDIRSLGRLPAAHRHVKLG